MMKRKSQIKRKMKQMKLEEKFKLQAIKQMKNIKTPIRFYSRPKRH